VINKCKYFGNDVTCCESANLSALPPSVQPSTSTSSSSTSSSLRPPPSSSTASSADVGPTTTAVSLSVIATSPDTTAFVASPGGVDVNAIVGACVGAVVGLAFILCLVLGVIFMRKRRRQQQLQAVANDYISGRSIAHPSSGSGRSSVTPSTAPISPQQTYANLALTQDDGGSVNYGQFGATGNDATMSDALSERNGPTHSQRMKQSSRAHAEPESAPSVPCKFWFFCCWLLLVVVGFFHSDIDVCADSQLDPNGERFAKFHSIDH
jgi:hypothetical protein